MLRRIPLTAWTAALLLLALAATGRADPRNAAGVQRRGSGRLVLGQPPPRLRLDRVSGTEPVTLSGLAGRVVVLDFWATWCRPCRALTPVLDGLYQQHRAGGLTVVGLSAEPLARVRAHASARPVQYTIAHDSGGTQRSYGVRGIPTLVVLGRDGNVRDVIVGVDAAAVRRLEALVVTLLAEPTP